MMSDWAFFAINLGTFGEKNLFHYKYADADTIRTVSLTFCALGLLMTPLDLAGRSGTHTHGICTPAGAPGVCSPDI